MWRYTCIYFWPRCRHGICQIIQTSMIPNFFYYTREKRVNRDMFGVEFRNEDVLLLLYFEQIAIFLQLSSPIQTQYSYFVKTVARIWQISQDWSFFALILENFTQVQNILHKCHLYHLCHLSLVPLLTNSMSAQADRKNRLGLKPLDEIIHKTFQKIGKWALMRRINFVQGYRKDPRLDREIVVDRGLVSV